MMKTILHIAREYECDVNIHLTLLSDPEKKAGWDFFLFFAFNFPYAIFNLIICLFDSYYFVILQIP